METFTVNGLDFALFDVFGRIHVECCGLMEDFDSRNGALAWMVTVSR